MRGYCSDEYCLMSCPAMVCTCLGFGPVLGAVEVRFKVYGLLKPSVYFHYFFCFPVEVFRLPVTADRHTMIVMRYFAHILIHIKSYVISKDHLTFILSYVHIVRTYLLYTFTVLSTW